jgi:hypothetical protein
MASPGLVSRNPGIAVSCAAPATGCRGAFGVGKAGTAIITAFDADGTFNPAWSSLWFHELAEVITDSDGQGWALSDGNEIGDACDYSTSPWQISPVRISLTPENDAFQMGVGDQRNLMERSPLRS